MSIEVHNYYKNKGLTVILIHNKYSVKVGLSASFGQLIRESGLIASVSSYQHSLRNKSLQREE